MTAREDQPQLGTCPTCGALDKNPPVPALGVRCKDSWHGRAEDQDARTEIYEAFIELVDEYHGSDPLDPNCRVCQLREIAAGARSTPSLPAQDAEIYLCPDGCGCTWRDNRDGTMSLAGPNSKSCKVCEFLPLKKLIPLWRGSTPSPDQKLQDEKVTQIPSNEPNPNLGKAGEAFHPLHGTMAAIYDIRFPKGEADDATNDSPSDKGLRSDLHSGNSHGDSVENESQVAAPSPDPPPLEQNGATNFMPYKLERELRAKVADACRLSAEMASEKADVECELLEAEEKAADLAVMLKLSQDNHMATLADRAIQIERAAELQKWKESQIAVTPDMQEIAKLLDIPLGKSIHDRIIPGIQGLQEALRQIAPVKPFSEAELDEHAKQLGAIGMCGINQPLWETRRTINMYIEEHFLPKRAALAPSLPTKGEKLAIQLKL